MERTRQSNDDLEEAQAYLAAIVKKEYRRRGEANGERAELAICWATFIAHERPWMLSVTLTFGQRQVSVHDAIGHLHGWFVDLGKTLRKGFDYVFFVEPQLDGTAHLHGLIVSDRELTSDEVTFMRTMWHHRHGFEKFVRLRDRIARYGAAGYAMKSYGHAEPENLVLSRGLRHLIRQVDGSARIVQGSVSSDS